MGISQEAAIAAYNSGGIPAAPCGRFEHAGGVAVSRHFTVCEFQNPAALSAAASVPTPSTGSCAYLCVAMHEGTNGLLKI